MQFTIISFTLEWIVENGLVVFLKSSILLCDLSKCSAFISNVAGRILVPRNPILTRGNMLGGLLDLSNKP